MDYARINGEQVQPNTCGRTACETAARYFWQSRHNLFDPPAVIDIHALAHAVRESWRQPCAEH